MKKIFYGILFYVSFLQASQEASVLSNTVQEESVLSDTVKEEKSKPIEYYINLFGSAWRHKFNLPKDSSGIDVDYFFGKEIKNSNIAQVHINNIEDLKFSMPMSGEDAYFIVYKKECLPCGCAMGMLESLADNIRAKRSNIFKIDSASLSDKVKDDLNLEGTPTIYKIEKDQWDFVENKSSIGTISIEKLIKYASDQRSLQSSLQDNQANLELGKNSGYFDSTFNYINDNKLASLGSLALVSALLYLGYKYYKKCSTKVDNGIKAQNKSK